MYYKYNKEILDFEKSTAHKKLIVALCLSTVLSLGLGFLAISGSEVERLTPEEKLIVIREGKEFSEEKLIEKIHRLNFKFPHIVLAQAKLESGNFKSAIFLENHNMFGMREARLRANLAKGTNRSHAYYDSWEDSLLDYALYYSTYLGRLRTEAEYFQYLQQSYAEDPTYVRRLKEMISKEEKNKDSK
jgi:uncharacterized FlgJ-related protein